MSAPVTLPVERLIPMIRNVPGRYVQALADRAEDLLAENKRLRGLLAEVRQAPDGFDGAVLPAWLENRLDEALR